MEEAEWWLTPLSQKNSLTNTSVNMNKKNLKEYAESFMKSKGKSKSLDALTVAYIKKMKKQEANILNTTTAS